MKSDESGTIQRHEVCAATYLMIPAMENLTDPLPHHYEPFTGKDCMVQMLRSIENKGIEVRKCTQDDE